MFPLVSMLLLLKRLILGKKLVKPRIVVVLLLWLLGVLPLLPPSLVAIKQELPQDSKHLRMLLLLLVLNVLVLLRPDRVAPTVVDQDKLQVLLLVVVGVLLMLLGVLLMMMKKKMMFLLRPDRVAPSFIKGNTKSSFVHIRNASGCTLHFLAM
jgi:protein-S-isoprenylcysteine O-methyltransferase Ste14